MCRALYGVVRRPEFGAYSDGVGDDLIDSRNLLGLCDKNLQSWAYWQFKGYGDPTTSAVDANGNVFEGVYDSHTGELDTAKVGGPSMTDRAHPQAAVVMFSSGLELVAPHPLQRMH